MLNLPQYQETDVIYTGTHTIIYEANRLKDNQAVIIKVLSNHHPTWHELVQFRNQYIITQNLDSPYIVKPLALERHRNGYALIMPNEGAISLSRYWQDRETTLNELLTIAIQLAEALHAVARQRIIHKDIKPANILIHPQTQQIQLIDFSIASLLQKEQSQLANPQGLEGTLAYIAPEQTGRMNRRIDYRTDFYSLGVTLYELLTGMLPFSTSDPLELVHCHIAQTPIAPVDLVDSQGQPYPMMLSRIIMRLMAKNAEDRYQSALGLKYDLERCLQSLNTTGQIIEFELRERDVCDRFSIPEKLYGREQEVQTLLNAFERISRGGCELMLIAGFSGIGKTAVVNEVHKPIVRQRGYFIKGKFDQFNRDIPLSAFVQALRDLIGQILSESDAQLDQWRTKILEALGENGQVLVEVLPELTQVIGEQSPAPELTGSAAQNRFKLLIQNFTEVFATADHPLVMFLDDLQWADSASLQLIKLLLQDNGHLLILGAYRDNETSPTHPLMLTVTDLEKTQAVVNTITLGPLEFDHINHLIADTLSCSQELADPLTQLVDQKTQGNPFFMTQFLKGLHQDGHICFNQEQGYWECDIDRVKTLALTDDVVVFMTTQIQKLPAQTQIALQLAACIGNQFDLETLAIIQEQAALDSATDLWEALHDGLIIPTSQAYKFFQSDVSKTPQEGAVNPTYRFLHDRVQQAAYGLIPAADRTAIHYRIGRLLLKYFSSITTEDRIFDIVGHLNAAIALVIDFTERMELARLNLTAAQKAKTSTAYEAALNYLTMGIELMPENVWQQHYDLALELHGTAVEVACLGGNFEQMEQHSAVVLKQARTLLDTIDVQQTRLAGIRAQGHLVEAIQLGLQVLETLGITFPEQPTQADVGEAIGTTYQLWEGRSPSDLQALPAMTDANYLAAMQMMSWLIPCAYVSDPNLMTLLIFKQVALSIEHGNCPMSIYGYVDYGLILCGVIGDISAGYDFGQLALNLLDQLQATSTKYRSWYVIYNFIEHWQAPLQTCISKLREAFQSSVEVGEFDMASLHAAATCVYGYHVGQELTELARETAAYYQTIKQFKRTAPEQFLASYYQTIQNLLGDAEDPTSLTGSILDQAEFLAEIAANNNHTALFYFYGNKTFLSYLFGEYEQAASDAQQAEQYLDGGIATFMVSLHFFYDALIQLELCKSISDGGELLEKVDSNQRKLQEWATFAPFNHQHRWELIEAERKAVLGDRTAAGEHYERAIAIAKENGFIQDEALASELFAKFYLDWGKEKYAALHMQEAYYCYARWGAKAKTDDLEANYPELLTPILQTQPVEYKTADSISSGALDFASIVQAAQKLASTIELEQLLKDIAEIILTNAGAQKMVLLTSEGEQWQIQAIATLVDQGKISTPIEAPSLPVGSIVPLRLVNYVKHTQKSVLISKAKTDIPGILKGYLLEHQPQSVLCLPLINQGNLVAIAYLEHPTTKGVFTPNTQTTVEFLCAQAAVALQNAQLYREAQNALTDLQQAQLQLVQSEKMSALGNLVAGVAHEINNPVGFLQGNIQPAQDYVQDLLGLIDLYQAEFPESSPEIEEEIETIDLEFVRGDLPKLIKSMDSGIARIQNISNSLRTFSRTDQENKTAFDIHEGLDSTLLILKHRTKANDKRPKIVIVKEYGQLPEIQCFPGQLNQVFMNVLANAIDAMDGVNQGRSYEEIEEKPNQIRIQTLVVNDQVQIQIQDNGGGMAPDVLARIFEQGFTTKEVGQGTGLGMAIAHQIITEKHEGQIICTSVLGQGTTFEITLPL